MSDYVSRSLFARSMRLLRRPAAERKNLIRKKVRAALLVPFHAPFRLGLAHLPGIQFSHKPDSYLFRAHPEFSRLFASFIAHNQLNNAGDVTRLWLFILNIKQVLTEGVAGDFAELGVWRGNTASVLAHFASAANRTVDLFDTYEGFDRRDLKDIDSTKIRGFAETSVDVVKSVIGENCRVCEFVKGYFPDSVREEHRARQYAIVSLDCDLYKPMKAGLEFFYPRMPRGALFLLHDYSSGAWEGSKRAIDEFCRDTQEFVTLMPDKSGSALIRKSSSGPPKPLNGSD
jgi:Macrocin-O-methyltransferase (TylF)